MLFYFISIHGGSNSSRLLVVISIHKIDDWSVRKQPLTVELRKDAFVSPGAFFKQFSQYTKLARHEDC